MIVKCKLYAYRKKSRIFNNKISMSLRQQINIGITLSVFIILVLGNAVAIWQARISVAKEFESSVNLAYRLIKANMDTPEWQQSKLQSRLAQIESLRHTRHLRIQLIDEQGELIDQLETEMAKNKSDYPDWFAWAVSQKFPSVRYQSQIRPGQSLTLIIEADSSDEIRESWEETRFLMLLIILMSVIMFVVVNLLFNKAINSVTVIVNGLQAIENGDYQHRIPDSNVTEFGTIARAVNHLTEVLAQVKEENRRLTRHSLEIQEQERQQLAKELHDEMGQSVTAIKTLATTGRQLHEDHQRINNSIINICNHLFQVVRTMMRNLHPIVLSELGLKASLRDLIEHWQEKQPSINYQIICSDAVDELDANTAIQVFRVIQECLTNIARHANARQVNISLTQEQSRENFIITVEDDGQGCDPILMKSGFGMMAIRERIENLNGKVNFKSTPGGGMRIVFEIPICSLNHESSK